MRTAISFLIGVVVGAVVVLVTLQETGRLLPGAAENRPIRPGAQPTSDRPISALPVGVPPATREAEKALELSRDDEPVVVPRVEPASVPAAGALAIPVAGVTREQLRDHFHDKRGGRQHQAIDIQAPRGTPVLAAIDGTVRKLFLSRNGGITIYQTDPSGAWIYYYAHLDSYAPQIAEGKALKRGEVIGFVGTSGNAPPDFPHLHFAIERMSASGEWWKGDAVNPYPILTTRGVTFAAQ